MQKTFELAVSCCWQLPLNLGPKLELKMLEFVIFAATFAVVLILLVIYLYPARIRSSTIPGLDQGDPIEGNFSDIKAAGTFTDFLERLHDDHGDIASFWLGSKLVISLSSPEFFEQHKHAATRPEELYKLYLPFFGPESIFFASNQQSRRQHKIIEVGLKQLYDSSIFEKNLTKLVKELESKWRSISADEHIPLWQYMKAFTLKSSVNILLGTDAFPDDRKLFEFSKNLDVCYSELETLLSEVTEDKNVLSKKRLLPARKEVALKLKEVVNNHRSNNLKSSSFLQSLLDSDFTEEEIVDNLITCFFFYYSITSLLTWVLYFISTHDEVQDKIYTKISAKEGDLESYLSLVMKETLRMTPVFSWLSREQVDLDTEIGGHVIPRDTIIIYAISAAMMNEKYWSLPKVFNPERFNEDYNSYSYVPFGFAGNRICPAEKLISKKLSLFVRTICKNFKLKPVDDQVIFPTYSIITKPAEEVWVTLEKR